MFFILWRGRGVLVVGFAILGVLAADLLEALVSGAHFGGRAAGVATGLGDRICVALAQHSNTPILTAERAWSKLNLGVEVRLIR